MANEHIFNITELSEYLKSILSNKKIKVSGEVSQPKLSGGHLYFSLKDESSNVKSIIWKSRNINKEEIIEGEKIIVEAKIDYYGGNGSISLIIDKIINNEGQGDLHLKYEKIKQEFLIKGYFNKLRKRKLPEQLKNILIITSESGAALQDFIYNLDNNNSNLNYDIIDVEVQGIKCPKNICRILNKFKLNNTYYDMVIITRGGGSFADLFGFSQSELIESVYDFHLPVLSAIGHMTDNPLLDLVADYTTPTPSLASQFIVDHNKNYLRKLKLIKDNCKQELVDELIKEQNKYLDLTNKIHIIFNSLLQLKNICENKIRQDISQVMNKLCILESKLIIDIDMITLYDSMDNKINNNNELIKYKDNIIKLRWNDKEYNIKIL